MHTYIKIYHIKICKCMKGFERKLKAYLVHLLEQKIAVLHIHGRLVSYTYYSQMPIGK